MHARMWSLSPQMWLFGRARAHSQRLGASMHQFLRSQLSTRECVLASNNLEACILVVNCWTIKLQPNEPIVKWQQSNDLKINEPIVKWQQSNDLNPWSSTNWTSVLISSYPLWIQSTSYLCTCAWFHKCTNLPPILNTFVSDAMWRNFPYCCDCISSRSHKTKEASQWNCHPQAKSNVAFCIRLFSDVMFWFLNFSSSAWNLTCCENNGKI